MFFGDQARLEKGFLMAKSLIMDSGKVTTMKQITNKEGYLQTTWCSSGELARHYLYGDKLEWMNMPPLAETLNELFLDPAVLCSCCKG